jgi:hypothetical protein
VIKVYNCCRCCCDENGGETPGPDMSQVIGVIDTGERTDDGAVLAWCDGNFNIISSLPTDYFDNHPSYQFDPVIVGANHFRRIPRAWWKRGQVPAGHRYEGNWYMLLARDASFEVAGFKSSGENYQRSDDSWAGAFLYGTYRAFNNGGVPGSLPGKKTWGNVLFGDFKPAAAGLGDGHHMTTMQEYHEILARAVIEDRSFNLWPNGVRGDRASTAYRGIEELVYHGQFDNASGVWIEWRDGMYTDDDGSIWALEKEGVYRNTGLTSIGAGTSPIVEWRTDEALIPMFLARSGASGEAINPCYQGSAPDAYCFTNVHVPYPGCGTFGLFMYYKELPDEHSDQGPSFGARISKLI